ncbi:hypothetical protein HGA34_02525 [Candidatus Falkowbacteria bacterium]|nr:hypothetical protein [Candidatus Falkowbacteria bacterium]
MKLLARKKVIAALVPLAALGMMIPRTVSPALAEELLSDQTFVLNEPIMAGTQEIAPLGPAGDDYDYTRSASLSIEADLPAAVTLGQTISVRLMVNPGESAINVAKASLAYTAETLTLVAIDGEDAPFSIIFDNQTGIGELAVTGMQPAPGISAKAQVAELYFIAAAPGEARIDFLPGSMVLANDGYGSDVLASAQGTAFAISSY